MIRDESKVLYDSIEKRDESHPTNRGELNSSFAYLKVYAVSHIEYL